jgi:hypothetical protein
MSVAAMTNAYVEQRVNAVAQAQSTILIHLQNHLRQPSRATRDRLEESLMQLDQLLDTVLLPKGHLPSTR